ncbi:unnamed protein product [Amoebophrya sp. A120]|nr:unnamed protein product [Amoebophrya sp. A120]|eukprot:GSA120T00022151001.1
MGGAADSAGASTTATFVDHGLINATQPAAQTVMKNVNDFARTGLHGATTSKALAFSSTPEQPFDAASVEMWKNSGFCPLAAVEMCTDWGVMPRVFLSFCETAVVKGLVGRVQN